MRRHSPVRNQRSKGVKIKHVLQICLLVAVCFWLIFQVKRFHDKKKEFDASDTKISASSQMSDEVIKFGRKDLRPKLEETTMEIKKHEEEDDEQEERETRDDGRGGGEHEIDENEEDKSDMDVEREEDAMDEDTEREESDNKENEVKDSQSQTGNGSSLDDQNQDGVAKNTHEVREENYKADDVSSEVTHDGQTVGTINENGTLVDSSENVEVGISEHEGQVDKTKKIDVNQESTIVVKERDGETANNEASSNSTEIQEIGSELANSYMNATTTINSNENGNSTRAPNITEGLIVSTEQTSNSSIDSPSDDDQSGSHSKLIHQTQNTEESEESSNSTNVSEFVESESISKSNESITEENASGSTKMEVDTDAGQSENFDHNNVMEGTKEISDSSETKTTDEVQQDTIDTTDSARLDENEVRVNLNTSPGIETEAGSSENTAAG